MSKRFFSLTQLKLILICCAFLKLAIHAERMNINARGFHSLVSKRHQTVSRRKELCNEPASIVMMSSSTTSVDIESPPKKNIIFQLGNYVKDSVVRLKDGTVQLYTNHKECNNIRDKQKVYAKENPKSADVSYQRTGITFQEYDFLTRGKEDRGRVFNLVFMMFFSPNFLPYAFMFFPNILPTPFQQNPPMAFDKLELISRERSHAVIKTLLDIEKEAKSVPTGNPLNPFGKGKAKKNRELMARVNQITGQLLLLGNGSLSTATADASISTNMGSIDKEEHILNLLQDEIYTDEAPDRSRTRLAFVPKAIMKGLSNAIGANTVSAKGTSNANSGVFSSLTPHFMIRNKVITHLQAVNDADSFLIHENVDLNTLSGDLLLDTCNARMIGTPESTEFELRNSLSKWLALTVSTPEADSVQENASSPVSNSDKVGRKLNDYHNRYSSKQYDARFVSSVEPHPNQLKVCDAIEIDKSNSRNGASLMSIDNASSDTMSRSSIPKYYNANLAKFALMCYNAVEGARGSGSASVLPRFLYH